MKLHDAQHGLCAIHINVIVTMQICNAGKYFLTILREVLQSNDAYWLENTKTV